MTKIKSRHFYLFFPLCVCGGGGGGRKARQGKMLAGDWEQLFSYVTHCLN